MDRTGKAISGPRLMEVGTTLTDSTLAREGHRGLTLMRLPIAASAEDGHGPRSTSVSNSRPSPEDWNRLRSEFTYYYMDYRGRGLPLREVRTLMALKYGFNAS
jgi:Clr5 domain